MNTPKCALCGEPMPPGEEMFRIHGSSGPCPKPPKFTPAEPKMVYVVTMYRWGNRAAHSYVLGVYPNMAQAVAAGEAEQQERAGKYDPEVLPFDDGEPMPPLNGYAIDDGAQVDEWSAAKMNEILGPVYEAAKIYHGAFFYGNGRNQSTARKALIDATEAAMKELEDAND